MTALSHLNLVCALRLLPAAVLLVWATATLPAAGPDAPSAVGPAAAVPAGLNSLSPKELDEGWILLFDGQTPYGWKAANDADWHVEDAAITASEGTKPGLIHTTSQWGDFVLRLDFRSESRGNSGVFLRTSPNPPDGPGRYYEFNIADWGTNDWPTGSLVHHKKTEEAFDSDGWQAMELVADGGRFTVTIDGRPALDFTDEKPLRSGFIGLQWRKGKIQFRNIKLKPLGTKSIFNGKDLSGWKTYPELPSVFSVTPEGWMNVKNGRGMIESEGRYGDFTLQLEVFCNGAGLNSGVFFRSIPGQQMNGYECQIQNAFRDGDRTKPVDCGTGGIFRRQDARKVLADDFQWFPMTIHADGRHMAAWVNGVQVSDFTDTRPPHENPRSGLRLEAGTIQIQGHDPTTDLSFRNLRIAELPPRDP
jgi:hypothetical protein